MTFVEMLKKKMDPGELDLPIFGSVQTKYKNVCGKVSSMKDTDMITSIQVIFKFSIWNFLSLSSL